MCGELLIRAHSVNYGEIEKKLWKYQINCCTGTDCQCLHTSIEEDNLLTSIGNIPNDLVKRCAEMSYPSLRPGVEAGARGAPPVYMNEYQAQPAVRPPPSNTVPPVQQPQPAPHQPTIHNPQPLPQTPMPSTSSARYSDPSGSSNVHNPHMIPTFNTQQPVLPYDFDPTRPPPPRPDLHKKLKRPAEHEVGPSKMRKPDQCPNCQLPTPRDCEPSRALLRRLLSAGFMAALELVIERASPEERGHYYEMVKNLFTDRLILSLHSKNPFELVPWDDVLILTLEEQVRHKKFNVCCCGMPESSRPRYDSAGPSQATVSNASRYDPAAVIVQAVAQFYANSRPSTSTSPVTNTMPTTPVYNNYQQVQQPIQSQLLSQVQPQVNNNQLQPQLNNQVQPQLNNQLQPQLNHQVQPQMHSQVQPQMNHQVQPQLNHQVQPQLNHQVQPQLNHQVQPQLNHQVQPQLNHQVQPQLNHQVQPQLNHLMQPQLNHQAQPQIQRAYYAGPPTSNFSTSVGPSSAPVRMPSTHYQNGTRPPASSTPAGNSAAPHNGYVYNHYSTYPYYNHRPDSSYQ